MTEGPYQCSARVKRLGLRNVVRWLVPFGFFVPAHLTHGTHGLEAMVSSLIAFAAVIVLLIFGGGRDRLVRRVAASNAGLRINDRLVLAREAIRAARIVHGIARETDAAGLELVPHAGAKYFVQVERPEDAARLLAALALPEAQQLRTAFTFGVSRALVTVMTLLLAVLAFVLVWAHWPSFVRTLFFLNIGAIATALLPFRRAEVGDDGVRIVARWPWRRTRFIPYADISAIRDDGPRVDLELRAGEPYTMWFLSVDGAAKAATALRDAHRAVAHGPMTVIDDLEREGRSIRDWVSSLRALGAGAVGGYRQAAVTAEALRAVVASAMAPARLRVAAAVALTQSERRPSADELRRLAARTGDVRVEHGLLRIADAANDDDIARALEEAERESAVTAPSRA